jgi:hypothetical protein
VLPEHRYALDLRSASERLDEQPCDPDGATVNGCDIVVRPCICFVPFEALGYVLLFDEDDAPRAYNPDYANRFWRVLLRVDRVFKTFRARFIGKCSPVHFFWGAADLAVTRFSGRSAPKHPGGIPNLPDWVTQEAYSHEVSSCGFWAGGEPIPYAAFYSYAYPEPAGFAASLVAPAGTFYSNELREFILPYGVVRQAASPDHPLLQFLQTTYEAAANCGAWERNALERRDACGKAPK